MGKSLGNLLYYKHWTILGGDPLFLLSKQHESWNQKPEINHKGTIMSLLRIIEKNDKSFKIFSLKTHMSMNNLW